MTDRIKGFLVTLENDIREDDAEFIVTAIKMIKGVYSVKSYIKNMEDYMCENKAKMSELNEIFKFINSRMKSF